MRRLDFHPAIDQNAPPGDGPIAPQESRRLVFHLDQGAAGISAGVTVAIYRDGSIFGERGLADWFLVRRRAEAKELAHLIELLEEAATRAGDEIKRFLKVSLQNRRAALPEPHLDVLVTDRLDAAVESLQQESTESLPLALQRLIDAFRRQRQNALAGAASR